MTERSWSRVFEVGVQRTGTSSLGQAFRLLGLRTTGWDERLYWQCIRGGYEETLALAERFEAFEDLPWNYDPMLAVLDEAFPRSKFIVLDRDEDEWVESYEAAFGIEDPGFAREWRRRKYASIHRHFENRPDDLLVMNIADGWNPLCTFLELPVPDVEFPHTNAGEAQGWSRGNGSSSRPGWGRFQAVRGRARVRRLRGRLRR